MFTTEGTESTESEMSLGILKKCKWCNQHFKKLAKSHIIPQAFFNPDGKNDRFLISKGKFTKRLPTGSYDQNILCHKCESDFNYIDSNAARILLNNFDKLCLPYGNKIDEKAFRIDGKYWQEIKTFLIYTLWKYSVSSREECGSINLGPFEDRIKQDIISKRIFERSEYGFISFYLQNTTGMLSPYKKKKKEYDGCQFYHIDMHKFLFDIKIDSRKSPSNYQFLMENDDILFIKLESIPPKRRDAMVSMVRKQKEFEDEIRNKRNSV